MNKNELLTPENCRQLLAQNPEALQHGYVTSFSNLFISQPQDVSPPVKETDAFFYLKLDIEPGNPSSDIAVLYIKFEPNQASYAPVRYGSTNGNASKPISHYQGLMDLLRSAQSGSRRVEVFLQDKTDGRNALVIL